MFQLIAIGVLALGALTVVGVWHHGAVVEGRQEGVALQFAADKPILTACIAHGMTKSDGNTDAVKCAQLLDQLTQANKELKDANDGFAASATRQKAAFDRIALDTAASLKKSQDTIKKQDATKAAFTVERDRLQAIVEDTKTGKLSCEASLAQTNALVDGALRRLRQ